MLGYLYMHDMGWGWAILMTIAWVALLGLLVGVVLAAVRDRRNPSPREILDRRLAAGEIDLDEYEHARAAMSREGTGGSPTGRPSPAEAHARNTVATHRWSSPRSVVPRPDGGGRPAPRSLAADDAALGPS